MTARIKKGDRVFINCGKDNGKTGEVIRVDTLSNGEKKRSGWSIDEAVLSSDGRFTVFESLDVQLAGLEEAAWQSTDWSRTLAYRKDMETGELSVVVTKP